VPQEASRGTSRCHRSSTNSTTTSEDAANVALTLVNGTTNFLIEESFPQPDEKPIWASSSDTEGSALVSTGHENRTGQRIVVDIYGTSATDIELESWRSRRSSGRSTARAAR
jgi:hypothetical protein